MLLLALFIVYFHATSLKRRITLHFTQARTGYGVHCVTSFPLEETLIMSNAADKEERKQGKNKRLDPCWTYSSTKF